MFPIIKNNVGISVFNSDGGNFAKDVTLRRNLSVLEPNIGSNQNLSEWNPNEWESFSEDTFNGIGVFDGVLNVENETFNYFKHPNSNKSPTTQVGIDISCKCSKSIQM